MLRKYLKYFASSFALHLGLLTVLLSGLLLTDHHHQSLIAVVPISISQKISKIFHSERNKFTPSNDDHPQSIPASSELSEGIISSDEMQKYLSEVTLRVNRLKYYPKSAQINEQEGVVGLMIEIAPNGQILNSQIENASSFESLNQAAVLTVKKIGALPPLPMSSDGKPISNSIQVHIPIHFKLM